MSTKRVASLGLALGAVAIASTGCAAAQEIAEQFDVELVPEYRHPRPTTTTTEAPRPDILFEDGSGWHNGQQFCLSGGGCSPIGGIASNEQVEDFILWISDPVNKYPGLTTSTTTAG